jgi:hypothetical protein
MFKRLKSILLTPSSTISEALHNRPLTSSEAADLKRQINWREVEKARQYINHNLEDRPDGTFWNAEDYSELTQERVVVEYSEAGWEVYRHAEGEGRDVYYFVRPGAQQRPYADWQRSGLVRFHPGVGWKP